MLFSVLRLKVGQYRRGGGKIKLEKTLTMFLGTLPHNWKGVVKPSEHCEFEWVSWQPPHNLQQKGIDPLLREVEAYEQQKHFNTKQQENGQAAINNNNNGETNSR